ncbi:MAG: YdbL family protein [Deltaproteobacteria bacterium]|nr:YdbL family protein [Deltaproteobacteria bacterium]
MMANKFRFMLLFGMFTVFLSCVTVNVYFPAKEVKEKAGDIVDDIRKNPDAPLTPAGPQSSWKEGLYGYWLNGNLAWAQKQPDSPAVQNLKKQLADRFPRLKPYFQKGALGEGFKGFVETREVGSLSAAEKTEVRQLAEAENRDRQALYQEVAKSMNIPPDQIQKVQRIFADKWQQSSAAGWWIQKEDGKWVQK